MCAGHARRGCASSSFVEREKERGIVVAVTVRTEEDIP